MNDAKVAKTPYLYGVNLHAARRYEKTQQPEYPYARALGMFRYLVD